jgi:rhomboid family GlyGly-CTERM serine protease
VRPDPCHPAGGAGPCPAPLLRAPWLTLALVGLALALHAWPGACELLAWDRAALRGGELWRLFTGHWVHWSRAHLLWDVGTFAALGAACELRSRRSFALCLAGSALAISLALLAWLPALDTCAGLSGIDSALFALLGAQLVGERWAQRRDCALALCGAACAAFVAKVGFELATGATLFVSQLGPGLAPLPEAHLVGGAAGILTALLARPARAAVANRVAPA